MKRYGTRTAADYLGLTEAAIRYHVYQTGYLTPSPSELGRALEFTQQQLDEFRARHLRGPYKRRKRKSGPPDA